MQSEESKNNKNPKQVLIDWVEGVKDSAVLAKNCLNNGDPDYAKEHLSNLLGQCKAMETVLKNSD